MIEKPPKGERAPPDHRTREPEMQIRRTLPVLVLVVLAVCVPGQAVAAQTYDDSISGFEYFATSTDGRFAGSAAGTLPGAWSADIHHTALCLSCSPTATITSGSFSLATLSTNTLVKGTFTRGTVQVLNAGPNCTNQTFSVDGILGNVGRWFSGDGNGTFSATLTHYRGRVLGSCITYGASVTGTLSVTF
jgi:hypothetical protein